jgi:hypothetical protein
MVEHATFRQIVKSTLAPIRRNSLAFRRKKIIFDTRLQAVIHAPLSGATGELRTSTGAIAGRPKAVSDYLIDDREMIDSGPFFVFS